ncbi:helix-turn-helix domain-containing protein [Methylotuvimicrobium sp. KM2]|uniref:helix-turn-helix domain-containing protein n=1 Tax=Methylotuvimicrobium sp. KM2 TaxID=3133976 RepID=UPI0031018EDE
MSYKLRELAYNSGLKGSRLAVLVALCDRTTENSMLCNPGVPDIAKRSGITERHARKVINELEALEFFKRISELGKRNRYVLNLEKLQELSTTQGITSPLAENKTPDIEAQPPVIEGQNPCREDTQTEITKITKRARARKHPVTSSGGNSGQWNDSASFRPYKPAPMPTADPKQAQTELRSIKSILGAIRV